MNTISYDMLSLCQRACPTGIEQASFAKLYNEAKKAGEQESAIVLILAQALSDGLQYGNWPQSKKERN